MGEPVRWQNYGKDGRVRNGHWESYFVYNAFCPMSKDECLVKIGVSTKPYERIAQIHTNSPFAVVVAAFTPVGGKANALLIERRILEEYAALSTRGEWIKTPTTKEFKAAFAKKVQDIIGLVTNGAVKWQRMDAAKIREAVNAIRGPKPKSRGRKTFQDTYQPTARLEEFMLTCTKDMSE